jgi:hypothetical protein
MPKNHDQYIDIVESTIAGIPCTIGVLEYDEVAPYAGSVYNCNSDSDYYGYTDLSYDILDRKGYPAAWLERKMTRKDEERVEMDIADHFDKKSRYNFSF